MSSGTMTREDESEMARVTGRAFDAERMAAMAEQADALRGYPRQVLPDEQARKAAREVTVKGRS